MSEKKNMTEEEVREALRQAGIKEGWGEMGGDGPKNPAFLRRQADSLQALKGLLEGAVGGKQAEVRSLQEKLARLQHGGGS